MSTRNSMLASTTLSGVVGGMFMNVAPTTAADMTPIYKAPPLTYPQQAVDGVNWKIDGFGGEFASRSLYGTRAAFTAPLSPAWGVQFDGGAGRFDGRFFGSLGGHLFTRDPNKGLLGAYVNHTYWDRFGGVHVTQVAGEAEAYWGRWTLQGIAGVEFGNSVSVTTITITGPQSAQGVTNTVNFNTSFFDKVNLAYYLTDDWKAFVGHRYLGGKHAAALGTEVGFAMGGGKMAALFAEGRIGEDNFRGVWGGLRFYFGQKDKPLIARHRQDDPLLDWMPESLLSITNRLSRSVRVWTCDGSEVIQPDGTCQ